jgi:RNase P subunit RPR2
MSSPDNPMAYLLEFGLRKVEKENPELNNDVKYVELKSQLLREAEGHFKEIQATYATVLKTPCHCGGPLEPVDHEFGKIEGTIYDSVVAKCKKCGSNQTFQFPKQGFISEARSAMALRDYLLSTYGLDYAGLVMSDLRNRPVG